MAIPTAYRRLWSRRLRRRPLLPLLAAATVAVDAAIAAAILNRGPDDFGPTSVIGACLGVVTAQNALLAAWVVSARRSAPVRLLVAIGSTFLVSSLLFWLPSDGLSWFALTTLLANLLAAGTAARLAGPPGLRRRSRRFRIGSILVATTTVAVVAGVLRDVNWALAAQVMTSPGVWSSLVIDATLLGAGCYVATRGWRVGRAVAALVGLGVLLLFGRLFGYGLLQFWSTTSFSRRGFATEMANQLSWLLIVYQVAYIATLLVWLLGVRSRSQKVVAKPPKPAAPLPPERIDAVV